MRVAVGANCRTDKGTRSDLRNKSTRATTRKSQRCARRKSIIRVRNTLLTILLVTRIQTFDEMTLTRAQIFERAHLTHSRLVRNTKAQDNN